MRTSSLSGALTSKNEAQQIQMETNFTTLLENIIMILTGNIFFPLCVEKKLVVRIQSCKEMQSKRRKSSSVSSHHTKAGRNGSSSWRTATIKVSIFLLHLVLPCSALTMPQSVCIHSLRDQWAQSFRLITEAESSPFCTEQHFKIKKSQQLDSCSLHFLLNSALLF